MKVLIFYLFVHFICFGSEQDCNALLRTAISYHQKGWKEKAEKIYQSVLDKDPKNAQALHLLGIIKAQDKKFDKAFIFFHKALEIKPYAYDLLLNMSTLLIEKKDFATALKYQRRLLLCYPDCQKAKKQFLFALNRIAETKKTPSKKHLLLGLGSGRCGTTSLTMLWNSQDDCFASHESLPLVPWEISEGRFTFHKERLQILMDMHAYVGEVCSSWLPYFEEIVRSFPNVRAVVLKRDKQSTVNSFYKITGSGKKGAINHWMEHDGTFFKKDPWDLFFPTYESNNMKDAIGRYWEEYYQIAEMLCEKYPENIRIFSMDVLNDEEKQKELLRFCGFDNPKTSTKIELNKGSTRDGSYLLLEGALF